MILDFGFVRARAAAFAAAAAASGVPAAGSFGGSGGLLALKMRS